MPQIDAQSEAFPLEGGWLCLGFTNTVGWHGAEDYPERLTSYRVLLGWCLRHGIVGFGEAKRLLRESVRRPSEAEAVLARAIDLREAIYRVLTATASGEAPAGADLETLDREHRVAAAHLRLRHDGDGYGWTWAPDAGGLDAVLWPIARSAVVLLTSEQLRRVRECANDPCGWLFVDMSRNRSRRWCDMQDCGNRVKARRHYQRAKQAKA